MRIEAYLRVHGGEATVRSIQMQANLPSSTIKCLKVRRNDSGEQRWWDWQTARARIDADNPDNGLRELLLAHKAIFPTIRKHHGADTEVYLEVVTEYEEGEEPQGLYLSTETIQLLNEVGAAFDNDVVIIGRSRSG